MAEQARRLVEYAKGSYFQHLRLYDFVLKNTKLSSKKYVSIPQFSPFCGDSLNKAMVIEDKITMHWYEDKSFLTGKEKDELVK